MRILLIDGDAKARAATLRQYALSHRELLADLIRRFNSRENIPGDNPNFVLELFDGWRVVMTVEQQPEPVNWCYHISVSVVPTHGVKRLPNPIGIAQIVGLLGIPARFSDALKIDHSDNVVELWFHCEVPA